jgi:outer membrane protein OmpA-like peptidoglycan-associated protein
VLATRSLLALLYPPQRINTDHRTSGYCASVAQFDEQRYVAFKLPTPDGEAHLAVLAYRLTHSTSCRDFGGRTIAMVIAIEPTAREQKMVTVSAAEMAQSLASTGRIALYGIYFDTNKADIKPESTPALEQIAALLKADPALKIMVVGHTDNVGTSAANLDLSKRRANAVVAALTGQYGAKAAQMEAAGMGMLSPVASNDSEEGRTKNRRVELVKK